MIFDLDLDRVRNRPGIKWERHGNDVLSAWVADMDVEVPSFITEAVIERVESGGLGYGFYDEPIPVLEAFKNRMHKAFNWEIQTSDVIRVHDVIQGLEWAIRTLSPVGSGIVVQTPVYPPFYSTIEASGRYWVANPLLATEDGWALDFDHLESVAADPEVSTLLLCHPHNPCGLVMTQEDLAKIVDIAERNDLVVVSDEIHCDLVYTPHRHVPAASISELASQRTVTITAATKTFNMAGLRMAFVHTESERYGPQLKEISTRMIGGINGLGQVATVAGWEHGDDWIAELVAGLDHNRHLLSDLLSELLPGVVYRRPQATYLSWLDCRELDLGDNPAELFLSRGQVALNSGLDFGPEGTGHVRLNFATSPELLTMIVERMAAAL
ncbi:MAG: aminotransferase [Acidimicrobiaceae bacterium]|nr:aminotransferase [Acidimicrobiaceae bacterium]MED5173935.1 PatB family C-S lyase [Actinomycetota bacterium]